MESEQPERSRVFEYLYNLSFIILSNIGNVGKLFLAAFLLAGAVISYLCSGWTGLAILFGIIFGAGIIFWFLGICEGANPHPNYRRGTWYQNNWFWWDK